MRSIVNIMFAAVAFTLLFTHDIRAQGNEPATSSRQNSLREGCWALQFQVNQNFSLSSFQGAVLSVKKHYSDDVAIRLGLSFSTTSSQFDQATRYLPPSDTIRSSNSSNSGGFNIRVASQYIYYTEPSAPINLFIGGGPIVSYSRFSHDFEWNNTNGGNFSNSKTSSLENAWAVGISGAFGIEWFASEQISLLGEYGISAEYSWAKYTSTTSTSSNFGQQTQEGETNSKSFLISPALVKFGLSVYF